jgi:autotransporter-associated beta strand protein
MTSEADFELQDVGDASEINVIAALVPAFTDTLDLQGSLTLSGDAGNDLELSGDIVDATGDSFVGSLVKNGDNTITLTGLTAGHYTGNTTVNAGTLKVTNSFTTPADVIVNAGTADFSDGADVNLQANRIEVQSGATLNVSGTTTTTGASTLISADYPGYAAQEIRRRLGENVVPLFALGCAGDCNGEPLRGGFEAARRAGDALGAAVAKAVATAWPLPDAPLRWVETETPLPFREPPPREEIEAMLQGTKLSELDLDWVEDYRP